ncbi:MAG: DUF2294 family protein [Anaerolineales bacterium]|nr:DUF2294 family protein [Anaerolineales bacterium]
MMVADKTTRLNPAVLSDLAQDLLQAWQEAHGVTPGQATSLVGTDQLAILIEGAFSQAELKLAEDQAGEALIRQYAKELLVLICDERLDQIEKAVGRRVLSSGINVNPDTDQVMFIFKLETY